MLMMAPASSIIFRMVPPWTFPATLASSGRMILPGEGHASSHPPAMPPAWVPVQPPGGTAIALPDELPGHLTTLMPATSLALPARGFLRAAVETAPNYRWEWKEASLLCRGQPAARLGPRLTATSLQQTATEPGTCHHSTRRFPAAAAAFAGVAGHRPEEGRRGTVVMGQRLCAGPERSRTSARRPRRGAAAGKGRETGALRARPASSHAPEQGRGAASLCLVQAA